MQSTQSHIGYQGEAAPLVRARQRIARFAEQCESGSDTDVRSLGFLDLSGIELESHHVVTLVGVLKPLTGLTKLSFTDNRLTSDAHLAEAFRPLTQLTGLSLYGNRLTSNAYLADALKPLEQIVELSLGDNKLTSNVHLAEALKPLTRLTHLYLVENRLTSNACLVEAFKPLTRLLWLDLRNNRLTSNARLVEAFKPLEQLGILDLEDNRLTSNTHLVGAFRALSQLNVLTLRGNNQLGLFDEVIRCQNPQLILDALVKAVGGSARPNPEFKLVILGQGRVGKTQLRHRLMGEAVVHGEDKTPHFDWQVLPAEFSVPWPRDEKEPETENGVKLGTPRGVLHVFDFGGQDALWASHRFFVSSRRSVFLVCASCKHSITDSRLEFWLKYIQHLWEEEGRRETAWRKQRDRKSSRMSKEAADYLEEVRVHHPKPRVVVVVTWACCKVQKLNLDELRRLCKSYQADLVEEYDNFDPSPEGTGLTQVRGKITDALHHADVRKWWTELWPNDLVQRLSALRRVFGFDKTGLNPSPPHRTITCEEYLSKFCGLSRAATGEQGEMTNGGRVVAIEYLRILRDLGVAHWVGDRRDVADNLEAIREVIFSPAAVRGPVYRVLWAKQKEAGPLSFHDVMTELCEPILHSTEEPTGGDYERLLLRLMVICELVFEAEDPETGDKLYLVPDRLPSGAELVVKSDTPLNDSDTLLRADLGFIPDMLMPRLIGDLWRRGYAPTALTRCSCAVDWKVGDKVTHVRLCADQAAGVFRAVLSSEQQNVKVLLESELTRLLDRLDDPVKLEVITRTGRTSESASQVGALSVAAARSQESTTSLEATPKRQNPRIAYAVLCYDTAHEWFRPRHVLIEGWHDLHARLARGAVDHIPAKEFRERFPGFATFERYCRLGKRTAWWSLKGQRKDPRSAIGLSGQDRAQLGSGISNGED